MDISSDASTYVNGTLSIFNAYVLFRVVTVEKDVARKEKNFLDFRSNEQRTNKELDSRIRKFENYLSRFSSNWR